MTMYSKTDDENLELILGMGFFLFFVNLFLAAIYMSVAIRQGHWQFVVVDFVGSFLIAGIIKLWKWNEPQSQRHAKKIVPQIFLDTIVWVVMAVVTGFSWTLITYTIYLMVNWPLAIFMLPAYYETKGRKALKKEFEELHEIKT